MPQIFFNCYLQSINYFCIECSNICIQISPNLLTIVSSEILIDPREGKLSGQGGHEADIHLVGVEGGLVSVLVPDQEHPQSLPFLYYHNLQSRPHTFPLRHVQGVKEEGVHIRISPRLCLHGKAGGQADAQQEGHDLVQHHYGRDLKEGVDSVDTGCPTILFTLLFC